MTICKKYLLFPAFFLLAIQWRPVPVNEINITITGLENDKGQVLVSLFRDGGGYPDEPEKAIRKGSTTAAGKKAMISFSGLPPGKYAAVVLHDENSNLKMDKNWLGLPKEGYGFSNNVMGSFGPPSFSRASFQHTGDKQTSISISMRY